MASRSSFGSIRRLPSGRYQATYRVQGHEFSAPCTYTLKAHARAFLATTQADLERSTWTDPRLTRRTVREASESWLLSNPSKRASTLRRDRSILHTHVLPVIGTARIGQVRRADIQAMVAGWTGAPRTIQRQLAAVRAVFAHAAAEGWINASPCQGIHRPQVTPKESQVLTSAQLTALATEIGEPHGTAVLVAADLGLRWGEVFALHRSDIDMGGKRVTVRCSITTDASGGPVLGQPKSVSGRRTLAMSDSLASRLAPLLAHGEEFLERSSSPIPEGG